MAAIPTVTISGIITATIFGPGTDGMAIFPTGAIPGIPILGAIRAFTVSGSLSDIPQDPGYLFFVRSSGGPCVSARFGPVRFTAGGGFPEKGDTFSAGFG
jgi:hypothetical protein